MAADRFVDLNPELLQSIGSYFDASLLLAFPCCSVHFHRLSQENVLGGYVAARVAHLVVLVRDGTDSVILAALRHLRHYVTIDPSLLDVYEAAWWHTIEHNNVHVRQRALSLLTPCPTHLAELHYEKLREAARRTVQEKIEYGHIFQELYIMLLTHLEETDDFHRWATLAADDFPEISRALQAILASQQHRH